jgi:hypothetical protein
MALFKERSSRARGDKVFPGADHEHASGGVLGGNVAVRLSGCVERRIGRNTEEPQALARSLTNPRGTSHLSQP